MIVNQTRKIQTHGALAGSWLTSFSNDPLIYSVMHETTYRYAEPVEKSQQLFRLQPVHDIYQNLMEYKLSLSVNGQVCNFTGAFGNHASFIEIEEPYQELKIMAESIVAVMKFPTEHLNLTHQSRIFPAVWMPWDLVMMQTYLLPPELPESELFELADYAMSFVKKNNNDILAVLNDINQTIYRDYSYVQGQTTLFTSPYEVYWNRQGVCQDFAQLFICLARLLNFPARYRVGYLFTEKDYENQVQADESHAWVEIYLPYCGWLGFDPTNGCMAEQNHIRVACGRHYNDATPTSGTFIGGGGEELNTSVKVKLLS